MSTKHSEHTEDGRDDRTDDQRRYPAEKAYGPRRDIPARRRVDPNLSGGSREVHRACDAEAGYHPDEDRPPRYRKKHSLGVTS